MRALSPRARALSLSLSLSHSISLTHKHTRARARSLSFSLFLSLSLSLSADVAPQRLRESQDLENAPDRCQANMALVRQSRPDWGLGFQVNVLEMF